jgi:hypothetical protein
MGPIKGASLYFWTPASTTVGVIKLDAVAGL